MLTTAEERARETPDEAAKLVRDLLVRAKEFLAWPLSKTTTKHEPGGITIIVEPADWAFSDAIDMLMIAKELETRVNEARAKRDQAEAQTEAESRVAVPAKREPSRRSAARKAARRAE